jgi:DNA-binding NtrC family response regulator
MQLFAAEHAIVLVITDLRFSRQGEALEGYVLAEGFRKLRPHLKVLYTTGSGPHEVDVQGAPFLHKPFSVQELLTAVHTVLLGPQIS